MMNQGNLEATADVILVLNPSRQIIKISGMVFFQKLDSCILLERTSVFFEIDEVLIEAIYKLGIKGGNMGVESL